MNLKSDSDEMRNFVLVGVSGVGKTTMGKLAAKRLGMQFIDADLGFEKAENADIDTLIKRYGDEGFTKLQLEFFQELLIRCSNTIFTAPPRSLDNKGFWSSLKENAVSIHLRGKADEIHLRTDIWFRGRKLTQEEKQQDFWIQDFKKYHRWRVRHCGKADHVVRVVGDIDKDVQSLCDMIEDLRGMERLD